MTTYWSSNHADHDPGRLGQPAGSSANYYSEVAERATVILAAVTDAALGPIVDVAPPGAPPELPDVATAVHDPGLLEFLQHAHRRITAEDAVFSGAATPPDAAVIAETFALPGDPSPGRSRSAWAELGRRCADTSAPLFAGTWNAAVGAARSAVAAADDVAAGATLAYALCRPPGHHAGRARFGGFCYLNNAALAAQQLTAAGRRVAIIDVDLHHGNGTQDIFWDRDDVMYASLHIDPDIEYPYFAGFADELGGPDAEGTNLNVPLPDGCDAGRYLDALGRTVDTVADFAPTALVVSLGVDTHRDDPIGRFALPTESYGDVGRQLARLGVPTVVVQEGGYHLPTIGASVVAVLEAWRGVGDT